MKTPTLRGSLVTAICLAVLWMFTPLVHAAAPDLTAAGVIASLKSNASYSSRPYSDTYNLGPTGLRGWI